MSFLLFFLFQNLDTNLSCWVFFVCLFQVNFPLWRQQVALVSPPPQRHVVITSYSNDVLRTLTMFRNDLTALTIIYIMNINVGLCATAV